MAFNEALYYDKIRASNLFGPKFEASEFKGVQEITNACKAANWSIAFTAYALATAYHETAATMQPIKEYGGRSYFMENYDVTGKNPDRARKHGNTAVGDGARYFGRGYVQLTWRVNYAKAEKELGYKLVSNPDLALDPKIAAAIMVRGMQEGWFTGKKLAHYFDCPLATRAQFAGARKIINGTDKAELIAGYALKFQDALATAGW